MPPSIIFPRNPVKICSSKFLSLAPSNLSKQCKIGRRLCRSSAKLRRQKSDYRSEIAHRHQINICCWSFLHFRRRPAFSKSVWGGGGSKRRFSTECCAVPESESVSLAFERGPLLILKRRLSDLSQPW